MYEWRQGIESCEQGAQHLVTEQHVVRDRPGVAWGVRADPTLFRRGEPHHAAPGHRGQRRVLEAVNLVDKNSGIAKGWKASMQKKI